MSKSSFLSGYIRGVLFTSTDESTPSGGLPLDNKYTAEDFAPATVAVMEQDCAAFLSANTIPETITMERAGFLFWLARTGSGAGFIEELDLDPAVATALDDAAYAFPAFTINVGDDGKLYH